MGTNELNTWLPQLLQISDTMFPTGSYAHSYGLEGFVQDEMIKNNTDFQNFIYDIVIPSLENFELPTTTASYKATLPELNFEKIYEIDIIYGAMKPCREVREASARTGQQRLLLNLEISDETVWKELERIRLNREIHAYESIILGIQGALNQMTLEDTLAFAYYQGLTSLINAAIKLVRIGQITCQKILSDALKQCSKVVNKSKDISIEKMGWICPAFDISSARHETAFSRLFIS